MPETATTRTGNTKACDPIAGPQGVGGSGALLGSATPQGREEQPLLPSRRYRQFLPLRQSPLLSLP